MSNYTIQTAFMPRAAFLCRLACAVVLLLGAGCARTTLPMTNITMPLPKNPLKIQPVMEILGNYREGNFQNRSWTDAFQAMHQKLSREYAFSEWKAVDWDALYSAGAPLVEAAERGQNNQAYYLALRSYLYSIPDGGLSISTPEKFREDAIGGGYGFTVAPLEDGRVVVVRVDPGFFADMAGIKWGAEIVEWDGVPVADALARTPLLWADAPAATDEGRLFQQCTLLTRAPVGTKATVKFRNPNSGNLWVSRLEARRDYYQTLRDLTRQQKSITEFESPLETKVLDGNIGYIKVYCQAATLAMPFPARAFRRALETFLEAKVKGVVLDLRGNTGGLDDLAVTYAGHFTQAPVLYRKLVAFDYDKGGFALDKVGELTIEPRTPHFGGPVMVLVHLDTCDNGQALADSLHRLPNVSLLGVTGTEGSWGYPGGQITMPGDYVITYPIGRMLDDADIVRITAGADMKSRVQPDIRIALTPELCDTFFNQGRDVLLDKAVSEIEGRTGSK